MQNKQSCFHIFISFNPYVSIGYVFESIVIYRLDNQLTDISTTETISGKDFTQTCGVFSLWVSYNWTLVTKLFD